jgi:hypothetical protein
MSAEQLVKETIKEFEAFHLEHRPNNFCKAITKREVALFALFKQGKIRFESVCVDTIKENK